jgi:uncharacterized protein (TIGR01777 family)
VRVVMTGGSGFIGRALTPRLVARGDEVVWLTRSPERQREIPAGVRTVAWDGRTGAGWSSLLEPASDGRAQRVGIVQLAGENLGSGRWTPARKERLRSSRLLAGAAVVAAVARAQRPPEVVIQASGVNYYGSTGEPVDESAPAGEGFLSELARVWEDSTAAVEDNGVRRVIGRFGVVLAPHGGALAKMALPFRFGAGGRFGDGRQWMSWIHIDDLCAALQWFLDTPEARGPYNVTSPDPVTNREFTRALGHALHRPSLFVVPAFALRVALGEMADMLLTGPRAVPHRLLEAGTRFSYPSIDSALGAIFND